MPKKQIDEIEAELAANAAEDERLRELRRRDTELARVKAERDQAIAKLKQAEADLASAEARQSVLDAIATPEPKSISAGSPKPGGNATAILCMSDWHVEESVDPNTVNGLNEFDLTIASERIKRTFSKAVRLLDSARTLSKIGDVVLWLGGDFISGYIHPELAENNALSPTEALIFAQDHICGGIDFLLKEAGVKSITIPTSHGNHGRTTEKRRVASAAANSFEWLMYKTLERHYRNDPRVIWKVAEGYHNWLDIQGKSIRFHHGDELRYGGGVGGITIPVNKAIAQWDKSKRADLDIFGHWHQMLHHRKFVSNNCLIGYSPFALAIKADFAAPSQTFVVIDRDRPGAVTVQEIYCTEGKP
jgi:hypothetical protein